MGLGFWYVLGVGRGNDLGCRNVHVGAVRAIECFQLGWFSCLIRITVRVVGLSRKKKGLVLLHFTFIALIALEVQLIHVMNHSLQNSTSMAHKGLIFAPFKKTLVVRRNAPNRPYLADGFGGRCSFVPVCCRPYHSTGVFR